MVAGKPTPSVGWPAGLSGAVDSDLASLTGSPAEAGL